jgi:hypothetical protein
MVSGRPWMNGTPVSAWYLRLVSETFCEMRPNASTGLLVESSTLRSGAGSQGSVGLTGISPCTVTRSTVGSAHTTLQISANCGARTPTVGPVSSGFSAASPGSIMALSFALVSAVSGAMVAPSSLA